MKITLEPEMQKYIGKQVKIGLEEQETVIGKLLTLEIEGDFSIETEDGVRYCWPALYLIPLENQNG
jgi:hypothetical protein